MPFCKVCKKFYRPLGYPRHRMMHFEERNAPGYVHNGHCRHIRHKCSFCGRVRFEMFMKPTNFNTRFGHQCWICADNSDSEHHLFFRPY